MARWLPERFGIEASTLDSIGLRRAPDAKIFDALRQAGQVIVTKDEDFIDLVTRLSAPPQILWVTCGNVTNRSLQALLDRGFTEVLEHLRRGEPIVELRDR